MLDPLYKNYRAEINTKHLERSVRAIAKIAIIILLAFIALDYYAYPQYWTQFAFFRAIGTSVIAWVAFRFSKKHPVFSQYAVVILIGLLILAVVFKSHAPSTPYYAGLMLLLLTMPILLPLTTKDAIILCTTLCTPFFISPFISPVDDWKNYVIHAVFLASASLASTVSCTFADKLRFNDFKQKRELEHARDHLKQLDIAKSRFTANIHHELRTPLTLMLAPLESMLTGDFGEVPKTIFSYFKTMHVNGLRLLKLINNLLDLAKVESKQLKIHRRKLDVGALIDEIVQGARPMGERKQIEILTEIQDNLNIVYADRDALEKILVNLVGNALKFTEPKDRIVIQAKNHDKNGIHIIVLDSGIGIPPDQLNRIFDRFAQVDESTTRIHEGTGIGLSLAKELIELHNGQIWAESEGKGHGTQMHVLLPMNEADEEFEEELLRTDDGRTLTLRNAFNAIGAETAIDPELRTEYQTVELQRSVERWENTQKNDKDSPHVGFNTSDPRPDIVIAEDNADMRALLTHLLSSEFHVRPTRNGKEALEAVREKHPKLVMTDVMMPEMSGIELCRAIKEDPSTQGIPVVLVTSKAEREMKISGLELGADDYITKPFHPRELLARTRSFVRLRVLQDELQERNRELEHALKNLRQAQSQLIHGEKMASLGQLVAGIAHEINNPLNFIEGNLYHLKEYTEKILNLLNRYQQLAEEAGNAIAEKFANLERTIDFNQITEDINSVLDGCREGVERTTNIVRNLRTFSRIDDAAVMTIDLNKAIESTLTLIRSRFTNIKVIKDYGDLPLVNCLAGQINQVFMNLLSNAADAIGNSSGIVRIRTHAFTTEKIMIEIEDNGCGIEPDVLDHIFDPFFTTKEVGKGTGLGLSISYGIIQRHNGEINVQSKSGQGTCFRITIPLQMARTETQRTLSF